MRSIQPNRVLLLGGPVSWSARGSMRDSVILVGVSATTDFGVRDMLTKILSNLLREDVVLQPTQPIDVRVVHRVDHITLLTA